MKKEKSTLLILLMMFFLIKTPLFAQNYAVIKGNIVEVEGSNVKIQYSGALQPKIGDPVEIGFELEGDFIPMAAKWKVKEVISEFVWVESQLADGEKVPLSYLAIIRTQKAEKKSKNESSAKISQQRKPEPKKTEEYKGKLFIHPTPANARIRILNIKPIYFSGMALPKGRYHIEVSARGFDTYKQWVQVNVGKENHFDVKLNIIVQKQQSNAQQSDVQKDPTLDRYLKMLHSRNPLRVRKAARHLAQTYTHNSLALNAAEKFLQNGYNKYPDDWYYNDALSWLCKFLAASNQKQYRTTLQIVAEKASNRKLRKYAEESLQPLQ